MKELISSIDALTSSEAAAMRFILSSIDLKES
jgi:hypothetical protein